jgi:tRNA pseudouridine38-40 synthase
MMRVAYDGTSYYGFQSQPQGNTIQDHLQHAIRVLTGEEIQIISSGRTDAGVHARDQVVNFLTSSSIPIERWCLALNSRLPEDIVVWEAAEVPPDFHARKSAKRKTYRYTINTNRFPDVFQRNFQYHHPRALDLSAMSEALKYFIGEYDFTSFCSPKTQKESRIRTIYDARLLTDDGIYTIELTGSGFLYNMVRIIVGTLVEIGEGKRESSQIPRILGALDRNCAGPTSIAKGLMLWEVCYDI